MSGDGTREGTEGLDDDFARQRELVGESNPVYARCLVLLKALLCGAEANPVIRERLARAWKRRRFRAYYERPLLLLAALRFNALADPDHPLATALGAPFDPDAVSPEALAEALGLHRAALWLTLATRKVQTNDVSRALAWRWPASLSGGRPLVLVDVGCSAGLNLVADRLPAPWVDASGRPLPIGDVEVLERYGYDVNPIDLSRDDEAQWLRACIWPGDLARLARLDRAIEAMAASHERGQAPRIERLFARHVPTRLRRISDGAPGDALVLVFQTFVREYMESEEVQAFESEMTQWLASLPRGRALWVQMELVGDGQRPPAELTVRWAGSTPRRLARCSYHPETIEVFPEAVEALGAVLGRTDGGR